MLHVKAMTLPEANGLRVVAASAKPFGFAQVAQILIDEGYKGPSTRIAPDLLLHFISLFDREAKGMVGFLGMKLEADNTSTRTLFDWRPIPLDQSVRETAAAIQATR
jgi:dihydroflavonol-4-reductase